MGYCRYCGECIGLALPPQMILAGKFHQSQWYQSVSANQGNKTSLNEMVSPNSGLEWCSLHLVLILFHEQKVDII